MSKNIRNSKTRSDDDLIDLYYLIILISILIEINNITYFNFESKKFQFVFPKNETT